MDAPQAFKYPPLKHKASIRLVILQPLDSSAQIMLDIDDHDLSENPEYEAISYEWGSSSNQKVISLSGTTWHIQENLYWALHHLRLDGKPRRLWVDALCINQDDTKERNHQVALMATIYKVASRVLVWLGPQAKEDAKGLESITKIVRQSRNIDPLNNQQVRENLQMWQIVLHLCGKPYWRRLWIIQEIIHASHITLHCGDASLDWNLLEALCLSSRNLLTHMWPGYRTVLWEQLKQSAPYRLVKQRVYSASTSASLCELVLLYRDASCMDIRDKVFGLHSLARQCCRDAVSVDYSAEADHTARDLLQHHFLVHREKNSSTENIPNKHRQVIMESQMVFRILLQDTIQPITTIKTHSLKRDVHASRLFPVVGNVRGRISHTRFLSPFDSMLGQVPESSLPYRQRLSGDRQQRPGDSWLRDVTDDDRVDSDLSEIGSSVFSSLRNVRSVESLIVFSESEELSATQAPVLSNRIRWPPLKRVNLLDSFTETLQDAIDHFWQNNIGLNVQFFIESHQMLGFAPGNTQYGDLVCQFDSSNVVIIVRKSHQGNYNSRYNIIGRAVPLNKGSSPFHPFSSGYYETVPDHRITLWLDGTTLMLLTRP